MMRMAFLEVGSTLTHIHGTPVCGGVGLSYAGSGCKGTGKEAERQAQIGMLLQVGKVRVGRGVRQELQRLKEE